MRLILTNASGSVDITQLVESVVWSGQVGACCRTLTLTVLSISGDTWSPMTGVEVGNHIGFWADDQLFDGFVFDVYVATDGTTKTITCYDRGVYLNQSQGYLIADGQTPQAIAQDLASTYGFDIGDIATADYYVYRNFLGQSLYQIIATAYTLASATTGDKYQIGFVLDKMTVAVKAVGAETLVIQNGSNLMSATQYQSIKSIVNQVVVVDDSYSPVSTYADDDSIGLYGLFQNVISQDTDSYEQAQELLEGSAPSQTITVTAVGDVRSITGQAVLVKESYTGIVGLFWIDSDTHTWKNGLYTNKLTLNFDCIMDEQDSGTEPTTDTTATTYSTYESVVVEEVAEAESSTVVWSYNPT